MGEEILNEWQRFHRETLILAHRGRYDFEFRTEPVRAAIRESPNAWQRLRIHGDELRKAIRGK